MTQNYFNFNKINNHDLIQSHENEHIFSLLDRSEQKLVLIIGSSMSGKSSFIEKYSSIKNSIVIKEKNQLKFKKENKSYYIDNNTSSFDKELLFHFIQNIISHDYLLYIFSDIENTFFSSGLKDLDSRFSLFDRYLIQEPDLKLMRKLITKFLAIKSIKLEKSIIDELPKFIDRTYLSAYNCASDINRLLYMNNHNINLNIIKKFYNAI